MDRGYVVLIPPGNIFGAKIRGPILTIRLGAPPLWPRARARSLIIRGKASIILHRHPAPGRPARRSSLLPLTPALVGAVAGHAAVARHRARGVPVPRCH